MSNNRPTAGSKDQTQQVAAAVGALRHAGVAGATTAEAVPPASSITNIGLVAAAVLSQAHGHRRHTASRISVDKLAGKADKAIFATIATTQIASNTVSNKDSTVPSNTAGHTTSTPNNESNSVAPKRLDSEPPTNSEVAQKRLNSEPPTNSQIPFTKTSKTSLPMNSENTKQPPFQFWGSAPISPQQVSTFTSKNQNACTVDETVVSQSHGAQAQPMELPIQTDDEFKLVQNRKQKRQKTGNSSDSSSNASKGHSLQSSIAKKQKSTTDSDDLSLFIKGRYDNIGTIIKKNPIKFEKDLIAETDQLLNSIPNYRKGYIRVFPKNLAQRSHILAVTQIGGFPVVVTEPFSIQNNHTKNTPNSTVEVAMETKSANPLRGVIRGVSMELTDSDIVQSTGAEHAHRITSFKDSQKIVTTTVILTFANIEKLPEKVKIGFIY
jgi:hypothetical protein